MVHSRGPSNGILASSIYDEKIHLSSARSSPARDAKSHAGPTSLPRINLSLPVFAPLGAGHYGGRGGLQAALFRPRVVIAMAAALVFFLGYITGSGASVTSSGGASGGGWGRKREKIPFLLRSDKLPPSTDPPDFVVEPWDGGRKIPPYLHYVFGMSEDFGNQPYGFIQYAALQSAVQILHPEKIYFHYVYEPSGWWWHRALEVPGFTPVKCRDVTEIYGNPVEHFAHKADVIRLEALQKYGGIYADSDVFFVRDLKPLYTYDVVMAEEAQPSLRPNDPPSGLCNAVILARPYAPFIQRWLESYRTFDKNLWATHSVAVPWELARKYPGEVTVLDRYAFFYPLWHEEHIDLVHSTMNWDFDRSGQFLYHAWESLTWSPHLQKLDPDSIHVWGEGETSFTRFVRRYIHEPIREQWRAAGRPR